MSGVTNTNDEYAIRTTPEDRARIQKKFFDQVGEMYSEEAIRRETAAFFGNASDDDFLPEKCCGLKGLGTDTTRLDLARLYMIVYGGFTPEQVMSNDPMLAEHKSRLGQDFIDTVTSGDPERVGDMWRDMTLHLNAFEMPQMDFYNDESMVDKYKEVRFYSSVTTDHFNAMDGVRDILKRHRGNELAECHLNFQGAEPVRFMIDNTMGLIAQDGYSQANREQLRNLGDFPGAAKYRDELSPQEIETIRVKGLTATNVVRAKYGGEMNQLVGSNFSGMSDIGSRDQITVDFNMATMTARAMPHDKAGKYKTANYSAQFEDLMDIEEISIEEMKDTKRITDIKDRGAGHRSLKVEISLEDLHKEALGVMLPRGKKVFEENKAEIMKEKSISNEQEGKKLLDRYSPFGKNIPEKAPLNPRKR